MSDGQVVRPSPPPVRWAALAAAVVASALGGALAGCGGTIATPSELTAVADGAQVRLRWNLPASAPDQSVLVLRRLNGPVEGPDDPQASQVFFGTGRAATDPVAALQPDLPASPATYSYAAYGCGRRSACERQGSTTAFTPTLVQILRGGGYVLFWRHADASQCVDHTELGTAAETAVPNWWKSCDTNCPPTQIGTATARQLTAAGRIQAAAIGQALDALAIPIGRVRACEYCRCVATAELMDLGPPIEPVAEITFFVYDEANRCARSQALLAVPPPPGTNTAIVSTRSFSGPCPVIEKLDSAEAAIYKPDGHGGSTLVAHMKWDAWTASLGPQPSGLSSSFEGNAVRLSWTPPDPGAGRTGVRLLRRLNAPVAGPTDRDATVLYEGSDRSFDDDLSGLLPDAPGQPRWYYYAVYGCTGTTCEPVGSATALRRTLVEALHGGGYTIYWRHGDADVCTDDAKGGVADWWKSCDANCATTTARQLNDAGRMHAAGAGKGVRDRSIPIGRVLSSEFCRALQSAELMNLGPPIEQAADITMFVHGTEPDRCTKSYARLAEVPKPGTNTALISHMWPGVPCQILSDLQPAEAAIFKPDGQGGSTFIGRVGWDQWPAQP